jgi:bromodomain-containing factor 1
MIERKLKGGHYLSIADIKDDIDLLYRNSLDFNGAEHTVTRAALEVRDELLTTIESTVKTICNKLRKRRRV